MQKTPKDKIKISKDVVDNLPSPPPKNGKTGRADYFDSVLGGFLVRVSSSGSKTYYAIGRTAGKPVWVNLGTHGAVTAEEARKKAKKALGELSSDINPNIKKAADRVKGLTLSDVAKDYFDTQDIKKSTKTFYQLMLDVHLKDWLNKSLKDITRDMVKSRHKSITKNSDKGPVAANNAMKTLRLLYNFASADNPGALPENPVKVLSAAKKWNTVKQRRTCVQENKLAVWYQAVENLPNTIIRDAFKLLLFTGLRKNEAFGLKWADVDFKQQIFTIVDPKNSRDLTLPMSTETEKILKARYDNRVNGFVFPGHGESGHIIETRHMIEVIRVETCKILNGITDDKDGEKLARLIKKDPESVIPGISFMPHDMRRTFAKFAEKNASYTELKRLLNHSTKNDVTQGYLIISVDDLRAPTQKITDSILKIICPTTETTEDDETSEITESAKVIPLFRKSA